MLELYFAPTPNGWKITIMLEEIGLPYHIRNVNLLEGDQRASSFTALNPNGRIPVLVDSSGSGAGAETVIFESGAILLYLAERTGRLFPPTGLARCTVMQWLMWQMSALGPTLGQNGHFRLYATERLPYAIERFDRETRRLYAVLDLQLSRTASYVAGEDYSVADIACFPWIMTHKAQGIDLGEFPHVQRWFAEVRNRPAVVAGTSVGRFQRIDTLDPEVRSRLFSGEHP